MENSDKPKIKTTTKDYAPALENSTKAQYSMILTMCLALILMLMGFAGLAAYANWGAIQRFIGK